MKERRGVTTTTTTDTSPTRGHPFDAPGGPGGAKPLSVPLDPAPRGRVGEPRLATTARSLVHGVTGAVFAWPLTLGGAVVAAFVGAATGALAGRGLAGTRLRLWVILLAGIVSLWTVLGGLALVGRGSFLAQALGPVAALELTEVAVFGVGAFLVSGMLRAASVRRPFLAALEVAGIGLAFSQLVVAHRHGSINRPFELADRILAEGGDPTNAILGIGVTAAGVMALFLLAERNAWRSLIHLALAALFLGGVASFLSTPEPPDVLGLRAQGSKGEDGDQEGRGGGQSGGGPGDAAHERQRRTAEDLEFRDEYDQPPNRVPVAVVLFHDDYSSPSGTYYFRQTAFSQYNGRRLVAAMEPGIDQDAQVGFPLGRVEVVGAPDADVDRVAVETTVALLASHPNPIGLEAPAVLSPAPNPNPARFRRLYEVESHAMDAGPIDLLGQPVGDPSWDGETRTHYTELPDDPRYRELAARIVAEVLPPDLREDPVAKAVAITTYLGKKGTYSLRSKHADAEDPTGHFLFGDLTGYCVHFAHAATYLMRAVGIPARVSAGYAVPESNRRGGSALVLTSSDAHAWPEIHLTDVGWVAFDVAVENVVSSMPPPPDPDLQRLLGELARGEEPIPVDGERGQSLWASLRAAFGTLAQGAGVAAVLLLLSLVAVKLGRRLAPRFASPASLPRVAYRAVLDALADVAVLRRFGESREAFARRVRTTVPSLDELTRLHLAARYGGPAALPGDGPAAAAGGNGAPDEIRRLVQEVAGELRRAVPWWRRLAGALVPWTWLRVR